MNTILLILSLFLTPKGTAVTTFNETDTVFLYAPSNDTYHGIVSEQPTDWFLLPDTVTPVTPAAPNEYQGKSGDGIAVKHEGRWIYRYILELDTTHYAIEEVTADCERTTVRLSQPITALTYTDAHGDQQGLKRTVQFEYNNLVWNDEGGWTETPLQTVFSTTNATYILPALYEATDIMMVTDSAWRSDLDMDMDTAKGRLEEPLAFAIHPTHTATTRWEGVDINHVNEQDAPSDAQFLVGSGPTEINFESNPTPAAEWFEWKISKGNNVLFTRRDVNQRYLFEDKANYTVAISVTGNGCQHDTTFAVSIQESFLHVPNVFTPNGDGMNDEFRVDYKSIADYHIWVYNRWNKLVYESTNPQEGWDGNINGRPAASGAYFYVIRAKGTDAAANADYMSKIAFDKKRKSANPDDINALLGLYQLSGDINLIREK